MLLQCRDVLLGSGTPWEIGGAPVTLKKNSGAQAVGDRGRCSDRGVLATLWTGSGSHATGDRGSLQRQLALATLERGSGSQATGDREGSVGVRLFLESVS